MRSSSSIREEPASSWRRRRWHWFVAWDYPLALAVTFVASAVFLVLPKFSNLLYRMERVSNPTGVSANVWIWTLATTVWIGSLYRLAGSSSSSKQPLHRLRVLAGEKTAWWIFVLANIVWMIAPLAAYARRLSPDATEGESRTGFWIRWMNVVGGKSAWPALWNVALVCIPVQRVSPLLESMGISSQQAVEAHIWAGNTALAWLLVHTVLLSLVYFHNTESWRGWLSLMVPYKMYYTEGVVNFMGWVGLVCFVGLWGFSRPSIRDKFYEIFKVLHWVFAALFLLGSNLHDYNTFFFVQPSVVLMVVDFLARRHSRLDESSSSTSPSSLCNNTEAASTGDASGVVLLDTSDSLCELKLPIPDTWPPSMKNEPGLHVYLTVPTIAKWQSHAYSVSAVHPKEGTFSIHAKALGNWSEALVDLVKKKQQQHQQQNLNGGEERPTRLALGIEGPYASPALHQTVLSARHCVFLAGGVGITGVAALSKARCRYLRDRGMDESDEIETTTLLWMVQTRAEAKFLLPLLRDEGHPVPSNLHTHVWITRERSIDNDSDANANANANASDYASLADLDAEVGGHGVGCSGPRTTGTIVKVRWGSGTRWHTGCVLAASLLSSAIVTVLSRNICTMQPVEPDPNDKNLPYRLKECSILWHSKKCRYCSIEDTLDLDEAYPCCTTPVCQYCFRGVPMVLLYLGVPLLAIGLARVFQALWLRSCVRQWGYSSVGYHDYEDGLEVVEASAPRSSSSNRSRNDDDRILSTETSPPPPRSRSPVRGEGRSIIGLHGARPSSTEELLSDPYLPFSTTTPREDVLVVLCGPPKLLAVTKRDLSSDPLRKSWRVVLAS